jgi:hypothetical protein
MNDSFLATKLLFKTNSLAIQAYEISEDIKTGDKDFQTATTAGAISQFIGQKSGDTTKATKHIANFGYKTHNYTTLLWHLVLTTLILIKML